MRKKYFEKENINCTFVGHPLLEDDEKIKIDINNIINENKKIISIFSGSRSSEINVLTPILFEFITTITEKHDDIHFVFHTTKEHRQKLKDQVEKEKLSQCDVISDEKIKSYILKKSIFAVASPVLSLWKFVKRKFHL